MDDQTEPDVIVWPPPPSSEEEAVSPTTALLDPMLFAPTLYPEYNSSGRRRSSGVGVSHPFQSLSRSSSAASAQSTSSIGNLNLPYQPFEFSKKHIEQLEYKALVDIRNSYFERAGDTLYSDYEGAAADAKLARQICWDIEDKLKSEQDDWDTKRIAELKAADSARYIEGSGEWRATQDLDFSGPDAYNHPSQAVEQTVSERLKNVNILNRSLPDDITFPGTVDLSNYITMSKSPIAISRRSFLKGDWINRERVADERKRELRELMMSTQTISDDKTKMAAQRTVLAEMIVNNAQRRILSDHIDKIALLQASTFRGTDMSDTLGHRPSSYQDKACQTDVERSEGLVMV